MTASPRLIFLIIGIFSLPSIRSEIFSSLFVVKSPNDNTYSLADQIEGDDADKNTYKFLISPKYELYYACPQEEANLFPGYALEIQGRVTELEACKSDDFIRGYFTNFKCQQDIKPVVLKLKDNLRDKFTPKVAQQYDIGFVIHDWNSNFKIIPHSYENLLEEYKSTDPFEYYHPPQPQEYDFIKSLTILLDKSSGTVISVRHMLLSGQLLDPDPALVPLPLEFNKDNSKIYEFDVNSMYKKETQQQTFSSIFGDFYTTYYEYPSRMVSKVQLAPQEDFLLYVWKLPTFMDLNTAPMWWQLTKQWRKVEIFVRRVARNLGNLSVETGTAKILHLLDAKGIPLPVYLRQEQNSPMPRYIWKLIKLSLTGDNKDQVNKAVLIVMHNDPYTQNQKPICPDISAKSGWLVANDDYRTGLTYVCSVEKGTNVMSKLYDELEIEYEVLNLKDFSKLDSDPVEQPVKRKEIVVPPIMSRL